MAAPSPIPNQDVVAPSGVRHDRSFMPAAGGWNALKQRTARLATSGKYCPVMSTVLMRLVTIEIEREFLSIVDVLTKRQ